MKARKSLRYSPAKAGKNAESEDVGSQVPAESDPAAAEAAAIVAAVDLSSSPKAHEDVSEHDENLPGHSLAVPPPKLRESSISCHGQTPQGLLDLPLLTAFSALIYPMPKFWLEGSFQEPSNVMLLPKGGTYLVICKFV